MKYASLVLVSVLMAATPEISRAQLLISEVMYDLAEGSDSGREWVEVYNEGDAVDLTEWKFAEGTTNHSITATGDVHVPSGAYAVIADNPAKFKADWPSYNGLLFDSAFSLSNTGETLILKCCKKELADKDSISYTDTMGAKGDGTSLSRSASTFVPTDPTPGAAPGAERKSEPVKEEKKAPAKLPEPKPAPPPVVEPEPLPEPEPPTIVEKPVAIAKAESREVVEEKTAPQVTTTEKNLPAETEMQKELEQAETVLVAAAAEAMPEKSSQSSWWVGVIALVFVGAVGAYAVRRIQKREWNVEEIPNTE